MLVVATIASFLFGASAGVLVYSRFHRDTNKRLTSIADSLERLYDATSKLGLLKGKLRAGAKVYWDTATGNKCLRCGNGKIFRRHRYTVVSNDGENMRMHRLVGICWCSRCSYRGISTPIT